MAQPSIIARRYLFGRLAPAGVVDAQLATARVAGVYSDRVPSGEAWAAGGLARYYVVFRRLSVGTDLSTVGSVRQQTDPLFVVAVAGRVDDIGHLDAAASRVDALLHATMGPVAGGYVQACDREAPHENGPVLLAGDVSIYELGGRYRLYCREE